MIRFRSEHEQDLRVPLLNSFLSTPHGKLPEPVSLHQDALADDPLFCGHLALWYVAHGEVRDRNDPPIVYQPTRSTGEERGQI
ncbi:hypothetical protein [Thermogemmatispora tikiterensis]|uniref:Uncharacterized protein n=1 Tax=Thermogemmatispora tikiterensis TaxID=1825093 RepID=A0A328VG40_9CHLR|nr:hypothetical protein [Thermogemmatispora tikiterensis]RAQ94992.1 hypothetical protein A4R35_05550 [Thermogemmatispora tikiterensis]